MSGRGAGRPVRDAGLYSVVQGDPGLAFFIISQNVMMRDFIEAGCRARDFKVARVAETAHDIDSAAPGDVVLLHAPDAGEALQAELRHLRGVEPDLRIVVLTSDGAAEGSHTLLFGEVQAVLPEGKPAEVLMGALAVVEAGYTLRPAIGRGVEQLRTIELAGDGAGHGVLRPGAARGGMSVRDGLRPSARAAKLSPREQAILQRLRAGRTNKDIANELGICQATVKVHLRACYRKIGAKNRTQAAVWAAERF